jgi:hypothetical protein
VVGAAGEPQYGEAFRTWAGRWRDASSGFEATWIDGTTDDQSPSGESVSGESASSESVSSHRDQVLQWIEQAQPSHREHWLVLMGHGTHDAKSTRFNLKGPDLTATELNKALEGKPGTWIVIVCASSSAPFLQAISGPNRIVITATKSGSEENFSKFGDFVSQSLTESSADIDHDGAISVLELFLAASNRVQKHYDEQGLLATEQALLDDNGDERGTPAVFYRGVRAIKAPAAGASLDGNEARRIYVRSPGNRLFTADEEVQIARIEEEIESLRRSKQEMDLDRYYSELEQRFLELSRLLGIEPP